MRGDRVADATDHRDEETPEALEAPPAPTAAAMPAAGWLPGDVQPQRMLLDHDHRDVHREDSLGNHWSVPWSDLMMSMFVLFAALVTAQALEKKVPEFIDRDRPVEREVPSPEPSFEPLLRIDVLEKSREAVRDANIDNVEVALLDDRSVKVSVQGPLFFDAGDDVLRPEVEGFLDSLAAVIGQTRYRVNVIGHTDSTPISNERFASNWELSLMRATRVTKRLIGVGGLDPSRFTVMGRSEYDPVAANDDAEQRSRNRRVEIVITRELTPLSEASP